MFERLSASFSLAKSSWKVLMTDKKLIVFPLISGLVCFLILLSFGAPFLLSENLQQWAQEGSPGLWVLLFLFYLVTYFVVIFFNCALVSCAFLRFNGEQPTLADGLSAAASRLPQIFSWALVSATVGLLLKMIENAHERAGYFISAILGAAWTVFTFFVVPVLVVEKLGPFAAIKRSTSIMRQAWGESLVGHFGIGIFSFLLMIPGIIVLMFAGYLFVVSVMLGIAVAMLALVYMILAGAASAALHGIFVGASYQYAVNGEVPQAFDRSVVEHAFSSKPR